MQCKHCGFANSEDDHRCLRCGRRIGTAVAAPAGYSGANALAHDLLAMELAEPAARAQSDKSPQAALWSAPAAGQAAPRLTQKVIPFSEIQLRAGIQPAAPPEVKAAKAPVRRNSRPVAEQENFDFVPSAAPRTLKDDVEAQIYCDLPVATPTHRFVAGAMDAAMIVMGFGIFMVTAWGTAQAMDVEGVFGSGKVLAGMLGGSLGLIALLYGLIWVLAGRETAGMNWSDLHLVTFDGFPLEGGHRLARLMATVMSFCSGGLGLLWALADAENLTWHDQISRTFPTVGTGKGSYVRQPRRR
jgi:hypothetical protein